MVHKLSSTAKAPNFGRMALNTQATGVKARPMVLALSTTLMVMSMKENSKMTRLTDREYIITRMAAST